MKRENWLGMSVDFLSDRWWCKRSEPIRKRRPFSKSW